MPIHRMHLKGPWQLQRLDCDEPCKFVTLPASWQSHLDANVTHAEFRRSFNLPTNLEAHEHVWIVFRELGLQARVSLNRVFLGCAEPDATDIEFEITPHLLPRNVLTVEFTTDQPVTDLEPRGLWEPVALEIRFDDDCG